MSPKSSRPFLLVSSKAERLFDRSSRRNQRRNQKPKHDFKVKRFPVSWAQNPNVALLARLTIKSGRTPGISRSFHEVEAKFGKVWVDPGSANSIHDPAKCADEQRRLIPVCKPEKVDENVNKVDLTIDLASRPTSNHFPRQMDTESL